MSRLGAQGVVPRLLSCSSSWSHIFRLILGLSFYGLMYFKLKVFYCVVRIKLGVN